MNLRTRLSRLTMRAGRPAALAPRPRRGIGIAAAAMLASTALLAQGGVVTNASWNDSEWAHSSVGTVRCTDADGAFASRGEGRLLSGSLLGIDLDTVVEASGVEATNNGSRSVRDPGAAPLVGTHAYANPLDVTALSGINLALTGLLELPTATPTGAVNQYAQALENGVSVGASGAVTDDGGVALDQFSGTPPRIAELKLSNLLRSVDVGLGDLVQDVADLEVHVGAVMGSAKLDGCRDAWNLSGSAIRDYLTSSFAAEVNSPAVVGDLYDEASTLITGLQGTVNAIASDGALLDSITGPLVTALTGVLAGPGGSGLIRIDGTQATINATIDTTDLLAHLNAPISDDNGVLVIDLANDTATIDLAALVGEAFHGDPGLGLNNLPPNTEPLSNPAIATALTNALTQALGDWLYDLDGLLSAAVDAIDLLVEVKVHLGVYVQVLGFGQWVGVGAIEATVDGSLKEVLDGDAGVEADLVLLSGLGSIPIVGPTLVALINGTLGLVLDLLESTVELVLGGIVATALDGVFDALRAAPPAIGDAAAAVSTLLSGLYDTVLSSALKLTVNAQNDPSPGPPTPGAEPGDWTTLPNGRYEVAALRLGVLNSANAEAMRVYLGRGSVGRNCSIARAAADCPGY